MKKIAVIIPVAESEDPQVVLNSAQRITALDYQDLIARIVYAVDIRDNDERIKMLKDESLEVFSRQKRGKRAGAINDALSYLAEFKPDYVTLFDIDSRPARNFITACVDALEHDTGAYIASSSRYISNTANLISRTIHAEYCVLNLLLKLSAFKQFNGLIGLLRADLLYRYGLNEGAITEDADYATLMHAMGYKAILVPATAIYEQSPLRWRDLLSQRKRWYYGGLQLWRYRGDVTRSKNRKFICSWVMALTVPYCIILFLPFVIVSPFIIMRYSTSPNPSVSAGLVLYILVLQYAAIAAIINFLRGRSVEWQSMRRVVE